MAEEFEYRYNRLTWPEMNEAIARQPVVILPTASTEQHGHHLPIDVDLLLADTISQEVAKRSNGAALVLPPIPYGLNPSIQRNRLFHLSVH